MTREEFLSLYKKYLTGQCSPEEKELLYSWQDEIKLLDDTWEPGLGDRLEIYNRIYHHLQESTGSGVIIKKKPWFNRGWLKAAAVIIVVLGFGSLSLYRWHLSSIHQSKQNYTKINYPDVPPGSNKAYLVLSDGSCIILTDKNAGQLAVQSGIEINKTKEGTLVYRSIRIKDESQGHSIGFNTITIPRGGQYQIVLADGSRVWLNASSSLRFPVAFQGNQRKVELTGEGYFEVAKNKQMPFLVQANGTVVKVLGTHFNISAYPDEPAVTTTLIEGSVRMSKGTASALLVPGQQAIAKQNGTNIRLKTADIEEAIAWKNGYFIFHDENIHTVMRKVARWYDVDVEYQDNVSDKEFGGTVSRYKNISGLLNIMSLTGAIHYKIKGRRVVIMK
jgi:hypothetical protein